MSMVLTLRNPVLPGHTLHVQPKQKTTVQLFPFLGTKQRWLLMQPNTSLACIIHSFHTAGSGEASGHLTSLG